MSRERLLAGAFALAAIALWLASHPYAGLHQDANLYTLMALRWLEPGAYANDPWFLFGSQDSFTIFSPFYGTLIRLLGISEAAKFVALLGGAAWLGAAWLTARRLFNDYWPFGIALFCCAVFSLNVSPTGSTFVLNEVFATPRLLAVPLAVAAIVMGQGRGMWVAVLLSLLATALHPLLGIWSLLFVIVFPLADRHVLALVVGGAVVLAALPALDAVTMLQPLPTERWGFLANSTTDLLADGRNWPRLNTLLFWLAALLLGARFGVAHFRRAYGLIALLAAAGYLLAVIVSLYYPVDLLLRCQPWRVIWLAAYFGVFAVVDLGWALWRLPGGKRQLVFLVLLLAACQPVAGALALIAWVWLACRGNRSSCLKQPCLSPALTWGAILALGVLALPGWLAEVALEGDALSHLGWTEGGAIRGILGGGGWGAGPLVITGALLWLRPKPGVALALLLPATIWAGMTWDPRAEVTRRAEEAFGHTPPASIAGMVRGQTVYWPDGQARTWFALGTAAYIGPYHLSGLVFSQPRSDLVIERWQRAAVAAVADGPIRSPEDVEAALARFRLGHPERDFSRGMAGSYVTEKLTAAGIPFLCEDEALDWVIATEAMVPGARGVPFSLSPMGGPAYYAYSCSQLRAQALRMQGSQTS